MTKQTKSFSKGKVATRVEVTDTSVKIFYHATAIVEIRKNSVTLNNGGWATVTTKRRMNQAAKFFGLAFRVFQRNFQWFAMFAGQTIPFNGNLLELPVSEAMAA